MKTCSKMIKVICKLSSSNAFQFGTFFIQFAVTLMMMEVIHFPNVVTLKDKWPSGLQFDDFPSYDDYFWKINTRKKIPFLSEFKPLCQSYDTKRGLSFMFFFGKVDNFFCTNGFLSDFVCKLQKKLWKQKLKTSMSPTYVRTTLILTTFLWVEQIKGEEVEGEENHFSKIIFAFFH